MHPRKQENREMHIQQERCAGFLFELFFLGIGSDGLELPSTRSASAGIFLIRCLIPCENMHCSTLVLQSILPLFVLLFLSTVICGTVALVFSVEPWQMYGIFMPIKAFFCLIRNALDKLQACGSVNPSFMRGKKQAVPAVCCHIHGAHAHPDLVFSTCLECESRRIKRPRRPGINRCWGALLFWPGVLVDIFV
jgi:hypothetical protein